MGSAAGRGGSISVVVPLPSSSGSEDWTLVAAFIIGSSAMLGREEEEEEEWSLGVR